MTFFRQMLIWYNKADLIDHLEILPLKVLGPTEYRKAIDHIEEDDDRVMLIEDQLWKI